MHVIEFFYSRKDIESAKTLYMLNGLAKRMLDLLIIGYNVDTEAGTRQAIKRKVRGVPLMIIDQGSVIKGVPYSQEQILSRFKR